MDNVVTLAQAEIDNGNATAAGLVARRTRIMAGLIIGLAIVSAGVILLVIRRLNKWFAATEQLFTAVAKGDLTQRLAETASDETGRLSKSINATVQSVQTAATGAAEVAAREKLQSEGLRAKVDAMLEVVNAAADGDLTRTITVSGTDAIGQLGEGLSKFFGDLRGSMSSIAGNAQSLASSSEELTAVSQQMSANAEETSAQAGVVSAAAEQVSKNVQTVATSAEQMSASIKEISKNAVEAANGD